MTPTTTARAATIRPTTPVASRPSYRTAIAVGACVLALYVLTLAPTTSMWDTSEFITAASTLGLPHPPGNPLFVLIGHVFAMLPIAPSVAARVNLISAISSAAAAAIWFLITERILTSWFASAAQRRLGGIVAALLSATAFTVWNQSLVVEHVYDIVLLGCAVIACLTFQWLDRPDGRAADRRLVLIAYLLGLGYTNHMAGMLAAPAVAAAVLIRRPRTLLRWKLLAVCAGVIALSMTVFVTQPIRSAQFPPINEGEPTACRTGFAWSCTFSKGTYDVFMYNFNRGQYGKGPLTVRQAPFTAQVGMWWYYFKWQWMRDPFGQHPATQSVLAALFFVLGLFGGWVHFSRDRRTFWFFGAFLFTATLLLIYYLNFKYGNTQPSDSANVEREVRDRDYFYIWGFSAWGVWATLGLLYVWEAVASFFGTETVKVGNGTVTVPSRRALAFGSPILLVAIIPLWTNWTWASRAGQTDTRDFAHDLLDSVEPYGVLVTVGDNDTFPLWYAQDVEGIRRDVVVANTSLLNTDWYARQLVRRPVYDYDEAKGPAVYRGQRWDTPAHGPLQMTTDDVDAVPEAQRLTGRSQFDAGGIHAILDPDSLDMGLIQKADFLVLRMIKDSWPQRPIYFSMTTGPYPRELGLGRYLLQQGLAWKLVLPPARPSVDTLFLTPDGGAWFDVQRSKELWMHDFEAPRSLIRRGHWVDGPSLSIPYLYFLEGIDLTAALRAVHDSADAHAVFTSVAGVAHTLRYDASVPPESADLSQLVAPFGGGSAGTVKKGGG